MMRTCEDCPQKGSTKIQGYGSSTPDIMFIGESPGAHEVKEGRPFSPNGASGKFLLMVLDDLGEDLDDHYYDNVVMCPCKGPPRAAKIHACAEGLWERIEELQPKLIVPMGNVAAKAVGMYERGISRVRSHYRELELDGFQVGILPTYHPAAVLRTPDVFRDFAKDIQRAVRIAHGEEPIVFPPYKDYELVMEQDELDPLWDVWERAKVLAIDLETRRVFNKKDPILCIGFGYARGRASSVNWELFKDDDNFQRLKELLETKAISFQHGIFDLAYLWALGIDANYKFDTEIAHWLLDERASGHGLEAMAIEWYAAPPYKSMFRRRHNLGTYIADEEESGRRWSAVPRRSLLAYNAADADYTWRLTVDLRKELREYDMLPLQRLIVRSTILYTDLYVQGINIDLDNLDALEKKLTKERDAAENELMEWAPDVNPRSPKQLAVYLYDELELTTFGHTPTDGREISMDVLSAALDEVDDEEAQIFWKTSRPALFGGTGRIERQEGLSSRSTGMFALYWLAQQHDYPGSLIRYKFSQKRLKTYVGQIRDNLWPDGKIRPQYKVVGHLHGRFGTRNPVIHNLPNELDIYDLYMAPPGYVILYADYKQADMRMIAHLADDDNMRDWLEGDPHAEAVKVIRKLTDEQLAEIKKERPDEYKRSRLAGKAVNFGMLYGRGAESLAPQLGVSVAEAKMWMKRYWTRIENVKAWMDGREAELMRNNQEFIGPFGNRRRFPLLISRQQVSKAAKLGVNFPIMSSVNYLTALAHIEVVEALRARGIDTKVYPHIHDSINVAVPIEYAAESAEIVRRTMADVPYDQGFDTIDWPVDVEVGTHWGTKDAVEDSPLVQQQR